MRLLLLSDLAGRPTSCDLQGISACGAEGSTLVQRIRHARRDKGASLAKNRASCRCSSFQKYISLLRNESHNYEIFKRPVILAFSYVIHSQSMRIDALFEDFKDTSRDTGLFSTYPQFLMRISALLLPPIETRRITAVLSSYPQNFMRISALLRGLTDKLKSG